MTRLNRAFVSLADEQARLSEAKFQAQVVRVAGPLGYRVRFEHTRIYSPAGYPDLTLVRRPSASLGDGRVIYAELKSRSGKPTPVQIEWLETLYQVGLEVYLWRPADYDWVVQVLGLEQRLSPAMTAGVPSAWVNQRVQYLGVGT